MNICQVLDLGHQVVRESDHEGQLAWLKTWQEAIAGRVINFEQRQEALSIGAAIALVEWGRSRSAGSRF
jgi:hypothetical protein